MAYFPFYKFNDKSAKVDAKKKEELQVEKSYDTQTLILKRNLRTLLSEIEDLNSIQHLVSSKNNILDIRRCILQVADKDKLNKSGLLSFSTELILESLVLKYSKLNSSNTNFKAFVTETFNEYQQSHMFDLRAREENMSRLVGMVNLLR